MKKQAWDTCHYYSKGRCPQHSTIDKAYLIPQLLDPSELKAANEICEHCESYHEEKRKHRRVRRPFRVLLSKKEPKKRIEGSVVDVSSNGVLVKLDNWITFRKDEVVNLQLYSRGEFPDQVKSNVVDVNGRIKRMSVDKQELAIAFEPGTSVKKCANI